MATIFKILKINKTS